MIAKKVIIGLVLVLGLTLLGMSAGYANNNSAPNFECYKCHQQMGAQSTQIVLKGLPKIYEPGKVYKLELSVVSSLKSIGEVQGGFAAETTGGELIVSDNTNTQLSDMILTHTQEGSNLRTWKFSWKAPLQKVNVELKVMAVAANGDFGAAGDSVMAEVFTINPKK
ncbi:MAG: hypothetical protein QMD01_01640 [Thermodesulfovibrionales bacterium]|nr:hypothetical protein [Thermodesulfovibrionales bacterium]